MATLTTFLDPGTAATQDFSFYASTTGTATSATDQTHTGSRSLKLSTSSPATTARATTATGVLLDSGSQISFYFRTDTIPTGANSVIGGLRTASLNVLSIGFNTSGNIVNTPQGATAATGTKVLAINTWYRISVSYYITNSTTYQIKMYVDGVLDSTTNAGTLTNTNATLFRFEASNTQGTNANNWFSDLYIATGGASSGSQPDTANILVTYKRPNANGTTNGFSTQIGSGGSGYGTGHSPQVNEQPLSTTNGWSMIGAGSAITEEYNIESASTGDVDISTATLVDYQGWVYTKALNAETGQIIVNNVTSNISITTSNAMFTKAAGSTTYPAGSGTDIGEITSTTLTTVSLFECGIIFAYTAAVVTSPVGKRYAVLQAINRSNTY